MRRAGTEEDAADRHAAPDHRVIVGVALAGDDGDAHGEGVGIVRHPFFRSGRNRQPRAVLFYWPLSVPRAFTLIPEPCRRARVLSADL